MTAGLGFLMIAIGVILASNAPPIVLGRAPNVVIDFARYGRVGPARPPSARRYTLRDGVALGTGAVGRQLRSLMEVLLAIPLFLLRMRLGSTGG